MADEKKSGMCAQCKKRVVVFRQGTNHILHLILTLITFGLWVIVWFGSAVAAAPPGVNRGEIYVRLIDSTERTFSLGRLWRGLWKLDPAKKRLN